MTGVVEAHAGDAGFDHHAIKLIAARAHIVWAESRNDAQNVPSPCISVCIMEKPTGWCAGCLRTLDEIGSWSALDGEGKRRVWQQIGQRAEAVLTNASGK